jgi:hypothetical protein
MADKTSSSMNGGSGRGRISPQGKGGGKLGSQSVRPRPAVNQEALAPRLGSQSSRPNVTPAPIPGQTGSGGPSRMSRPTNAKGVPVRPVSGGTTQSVGAAGNRVPHSDTTHTLGAAATHAATTIHQSLSGPLGRQPWKPGQSAADVC